MIYTALKMNIGAVLCVGYNSFTRRPYFGRYGYKVPETREKKGSSSHVSVNTFTVVIAEPHGE